MSVVAMGISEALGNAYLKVEDAYYAVLDFFEEKGVGFPWSYNDFLETKGIPALPFTLALLAVLAGGLFYAFSASTPQEVTFTISLTDNKGRALEDVSVRITDSRGRILDELTASNGQAITLKGVAPNETLTITATKQGFSSNKGTLLVGENRFRLSLEGSNDAIVGKLKLVDSETQTAITNAIITAEWAGSQTPLTASPGSDGIILLNVPLDEEISLSVRADNYEDLFDVITFSNDDVKIKELTPKASATQGSSVLVVKAIDAKTQLPLEDVHIKIEHAKTGETISDLDSTSGTHSENLTKGLVVRVSVSKEGYTAYTSNTEYAGGKTLRNEEEIILAPLSFGGTALNVVTQSESSKQPLSGVELTLLDDADEKIDMQTSNFSGEAAFPGLNETNTYTLLAYSSNFFPKRVNVDLPTLATSESGKTLLLPLTPFVSGNAGTLTIFVSEKDGKAATQASISITEISGENYLPLIAARTPDSVGSFTIRLPVGMKILVHAQKGSVSEEEEITITTGLNKVVLTLDDDAQLNTLTLTASGKPFIGNVQLLTSSGNELFSGAVTDGEIIFAAPENETITLIATDASGNKFTQTFSMGTAREKTLALDGTQPAGNAPAIVFEGLFDVSGNPVAGISTQQDAFARFKITWPAASAGAHTGGIFVRVGEDAVASADSQFVGIMGVNGDADTITYGRSWTPTPAPGKETKDRSTSGKAGTPNQWIELSVKKPLGTQTIDVRINARTGVKAGNIPIHYRAFVSVGNQTLRTPTDAVLGTAVYTAAKSGLYASTLSTSVSVYDVLPFCQGKICTTIQFVDTENRTFPAGTFSALTGKLYALQVGVQTTKATAPATTGSTSGEGLVPPGSVNTGTTAVNTPAGSATVKLSTPAESPLLAFTKSEINTFGTFVDTGSRDTSITFSLPGTQTANGSSARAHFIAENEGETLLTLQIIFNNESYTQTIPLRITTAKQLLVTTDELVESGEKINVRVQGEDSALISNALLTLTDASGKFAGSVKGTNTSGKGEQGTYVIDKALEVGLYTLRVSAEGYADAQTFVRVGIDSPLRIAEKITLTLPFGQTTITQQVPITNTTKHAISTITGELIELGEFPQELLVRVGTVPALSPGASGNIPITLTYEGDVNTTQTLSGSATLRIHGTAAAAFPVAATSTLTAVYNPKLDASCVTFSKEKLSVSFVGESQPYGNMYDGSTYTGNNYYGTTQGPAYNSYNTQGYNSYGFNAAGQYQNAETKRVNVKVKNNCGETLNLVPGISQQDGQVVVDGLKIAVIDSALQLTNGQEKQVDFEVSNDLFRASFAGGGINYVATFSSPQLYAALPFEITFLDRTHAIQTVDTVELTLIKTGTEKAVDRVNIPITNIGGAPITQLTATLQGENTPNVTIKLENAGASTSSGVGATTNPTILLPGQTRYPPISIVAESLRDEVSVVSKTLILSGTIEGRRFTLREIPIFVRTGSSSCLELSAFDTPVSFVSSEIVGTISKRITVKNNCIEPVRVTQVVAPAAIGTNRFSIASAEGSDIVEMGQEAEFNLVLEKSQAFKNEFTLQLNGLLMFTQRAIISNTLPVLVALGSNELEFSQASNPVQVNVCEGGNITVRFPILAKKDECSQAYCDAEQAGHYLAQTIEKQIAKVTQQMQAKRNDATQFDACSISSRYCTFSQLGITSPQLTLYLQNDALTPNMLSYVMRSGTYPRLASLLVQAEPSMKGESADSAFASRLGTGFGNAVYLPEINGCGVYTLSIIGGVEVVANQLQSDKVSIGIKLTRDKTNTAECSDKIYNAANFLPRDRSLSVENNQQTRAGVVEYASAALKEPAEWLAETVFGSRTRATQNSSSNRMTLNVGNLAQSIVELTLDPLTRGEGAKNIITVVRQTQGSVQKEAVVEAGKIITSLGKNVNGCITRDEQTWRIYSIADVGQFTYEGCSLANATDGGLMVRSTSACCALSTRSDILSDVSYTLDPNGTQAIPGVSGIDLYEVGEPKSNTNTFAKPGNKISYGAAYPLTFNTTTQTYGKDVLLCGTADMYTQQQANGQRVQTIATRTLDETRAGPLALELRTCTLDADDALAKAYEKGNGVWYATVDWDDDTARKTIMQTLAEATQRDKLGQAYVTYQGQGIMANDNPYYQQQFKEKQLDALMGYGGACALACGICAAGVTGITAGLGSALIWDCAVGCGLPTGIAAAGVYSEDIQQAAEGTFLEGTTNALVGGGASLVESTLQDEEGPADIALGTGLTYAAGRGTLKGVKTYKETAAKVNSEFDKAQAAVKKANETIANDIKTAEKALTEAKASGEKIVGELTEQLTAVQAELGPMEEKLKQAQEALSQSAAAREQAKAEFESIKEALETLPEQDPGKQAALASAQRTTDEATRAAQAANETVVRAREAVAAGELAAQNTAQAVARQQLIVEDVTRELSIIQKARAATPDAATIARQLNIDTVSSNLNARYTNLQTLKKEWDGLARLEKAVIKAEGNVGKRFVKGNVLTSDYQDHVFWKAVRREGDSFVFDLEVYTADGREIFKNVSISDLPNYGMQEVAERYRVLNPSELAEYTQKFSSEFTLLQNEIQDATQKLTDIRVQNISPAVNNLVDARIAEMGQFRTTATTAQETVFTSIASRKGIPVNYLPKSQVNALSNGLDVIVQSRITEIQKATAAQADELIFNAGESQGRLSILQEEMVQARTQVDSLSSGLTDLTTKATAADDAARAASAQFENARSAAGATADELTELAAARQEARLALLESSDVMREAQAEFNNLSQELGEQYNELGGSQADIAKKLEDAAKARDTATAKAQAALDDAKAKKTIPDAVPGSKTTGLAKSVAKGLVCSGAGNVAGYFAYRSLITDEVENKIELVAGSDAMLDAQTQEMIFEKGQTYQFSLSPTQGEGKSLRMSVDIVSPTAQVNPAAWLECD